MATFTHALDAEIPEPCRGGVATIGNFDGVHRGHQTLLRETVRQAKALDAPALVVTFDPHPTQFLRPDLLGPPLTTLADRSSLLHAHGVDHVLILQTSPALLQLEAREFVDRIVHQDLKVKALVEGFNFAFGRGRAGTIEVLRELCSAKGIAVTLMPAEEMLGAPVSSSRVRTELLAGRVDIVRQLLDRPYRLTGVVGIGQKRGATLGFPTANLENTKTLIPGNGVYAALAIVDHTPYAAAVNVGPNPTFGENARKVEAHLLGFAGHLYDKTLAIDFIRKIRDTKAFASAQELVVQINKDIENVKTSRLV